MSLYNLKTIRGYAGAERKKRPDVYRMVKFDKDMNVEAAYELTFNRGRWHCDCPAMNRPTCRHREMVPMFIKAKRVDKSFMWDYDKEEWTV